MRRTLVAIGWFLFAIDAVAALLLLQWALSAGERDGEIAYALVFLLISVLWLVVGGGGLACSARRGSLFGLWASAVVLAIPPLAVVVMRVLNAL